jgi:hypothetical protein
MYKTGGPWRNLQFPAGANKTDSEKNLAKPTTVTTISSPKSTPTAEPSTVSTIQTTTTTKATTTPLPILFSCSVSDPAGNEHDSIAVTNLRLKRLSELKFLVSIESRIWPSLQIHWRERRLRNYVWWRDFNDFWCCPVSQFPWRIVKGFA